ncbi:MFS transporter [Actinoplanes sp. NPDC049596]|uniref:MFS transporter n=1 Tax=unclassified Actinoplanes TaxID=2626549 RepID=UPI00342A7BF5
MSTGTLVPVPVDDVGHARRWWIMVVLGAVSFMANLDLFVVNVAIPTIARSFHQTDLVPVSWVLTAYAIVFAALMVPSGRLADHFGRRGFLLTGLIVFTAGSALCALSPGLAALIVSRGVQAVGAAIVVPTSLSLLLPAFPVRRHTLVISLWAAVAAVAAASGPVIGGVLSEADWRWIFLINAPIGVAAFLLGMWCLPRLPRHADSRLPEPVSTALLLTTVTLLVLATVQGPSWGWGSSRVIVLYVAGAAALAGVVAAAIRHPQALVEAHLFRNREFGSSAAGLFAYYTVLAGWLLVTVLFLQEVWHYGTLKAGVAMLPAPLCTAIVAVNSSAVSKRLGRTIPPAVGLLSLMVAFALAIAWVPSRPAYGGVFVWTLVMAGAGSGLIQAPLLSSAATLPAQRATTGSAVLNTARQIGAAVGVAVAVSLLSGASDPSSLAAVHRVWVFLLIGSGVGAAVLVAMRRGLGGYGR